MKSNAKLAPGQLSRGLGAAGHADPREGHSAEIIDLATRNVLPQVARTKGRSDAMGLAAGIGIVAALGAVTLWSMNTAREANEAVAPPAPSPIAEAPPLPPQAITPYTPPGAAPQPAPAPQPVLAAPPQPAVVAQPGANPYASPTVVFDSSALPVPLAAPAAPSALAPAPGAPGSNDDAFAARLGGVGGGPATAAVSIDPATTVTQGTLIPAVLETAIDTDVPGFVRAVVSADVRSFDGRHVLVPRSSRLIGQYKSGLQAGQKRAYVIWTRLIRPDGVSVAIASPAVGFAGETGIAGKVDNHFFARFGSAMLLSVVGGLAAPSGAAGLIVAGGGQSASAAAVEQTGKIGPTIRVRQGEPIRVFTARDLDFSKVPAA